MASFKRLFFDVPGFGRVDAEPGGSFKPEGFNRTMAMSDAGAVGPEEEPTYGELDFTLLNKAGLSIKAIGDLKNVAVTVQDDAGKTWHCAEAFVTTPPKMSNGRIPVSMFFKRSQEVV